jgi:hypothetical protein
LIWGIKLEEREGKADRIFTTFIIFLSADPYILCLSLKIYTSNQSPRPWLSDAKKRLLNHSTNIGKKMKTKFNQFPSEKFSQKSVGKNEKKIQPLTKNIGHDGPIIQKQRGCQLSLNFRIARATLAVAVSLRGNLWR